MLNKAEIKMMTIFNTDLQHHKFMPWFNILMLMYFMHLLPFLVGERAQKRFVTTSFQLLGVPSGLRLWHCHPS